MSEKLKPGLNVVIHIDDDEFSKYMNPPEETNTDKKDEDENNASK